MELSICEVTVAIAVFAATYYVYRANDLNKHLKVFVSRLKVHFKKKSTNFKELVLNDGFENPQLLNDAKSFDSIKIWAKSSDSCSIYLNFTRLIGRKAEISIILTLPDGTVYHLPNHPDTVIFDANSNSWSGGNLKLIPLQPFTRWRVIFNGPMIKGCTNESIDNKSLSTVIIKFNFVWIAATDPMRVPDDCTISSNMKRLNYNSHNGFDQFGNMMGNIYIGDQLEPTFYSLVGMKMRRWGPNYLTFIQNTVNIFGVAVDGALFILESDDIKTSFVSGLVRNPGGEVFIIDEVSSNIFDIQDLISNPTDTTLVIKIQAGMKEFLCKIKIEGRNPYLLRGGRPWNWEGSIFQTKFDINGYDGSGILESRVVYNGICPLKEMPEMKQLQWLEIENIPSDGLCVSFESVSCFCPQFVGAKGASLALLYSVKDKEYEVPFGFCVSIRALERHIEKNPAIGAAIKAILESNKNYNEMEFKQKCELTCKLIKSTAIDPIVKSEIEKSFMDMHEKIASSTNVYFAVRSSGVGEDSEELSAAGQNSTILGCESINDILSAVQECWASLFTFQSVEYRRVHGQQLACGMGVVVQVMVDASAAGVMFTRHPSSGSPECILITSNYGLGETVVSGQVEPDHIYIERDVKDNLKIKIVEIGSKSHKMCLNRSSDDQESKIKSVKIEDKENVASLNEFEALSLGKIAVTQETLWGSPRDIEWAIANGIIYLVQARPITTLQSWSESELLHELDSPVMSETDLVTFANTGEVLPNVVSPLAQSTMSTCLNRQIGIANLQKPYKYAWTTMAFTHYRLAINVFNTMAKEVNEKLSIIEKVSDISLYGHIVTDEKLHSIAVHKNGIVGKLKSMFMIMKMTWLMWRKDRISQRAKEDSIDFNIDLTNCNSIEKIYEKIHDFKPLMKIADDHLTCSSASFFSQFVFFSILLEGKTDFTSENYADIGRVLSSCTDVISGEIPTNLSRLAKAIKLSNKSDEFCKISPENGMKWLEKNCPNVYNDFQTFLSKHGHRSLSELDFITDTWEANPTSLISALQTTLLYPLIDERIKDNRDLVSQLSSPISNVTKKILKFIIPMCQNSVACRETTKSALALFINKYRMAYKKLAAEMIAEWLLPDEKLIFYFTKYELEKYIETRDPGFINKAMLRRRYFPKWNTFKFDEMQWGNPKPKNQTHFAIINSNENPVVRGTPVCPGNLVGRACVVHDLSEINTLKNGDILITNSTDIGWSPYFPLLGGVVTELGGLISHGAVVAREYGLPCIVGAQDATSVFKTGDVILLDSTKGLIQKYVEP